MQLGRRVRIVLLDGPTVPSLVGAVDDAELLVVGGRGSAALAGLALDSVSRGVLRGVSCPVLVLPASTTERIAATRSVLRTWSTG